MRFFAALVGAVFLIPISAAADATIYVSPPRQTISVGERFDVTIRADSTEMPITAAEAELKYEVGSLTVEKVAIEGSILTVWSTKPEVWTDTGIIRFAGWTGEHFKGSSGLLVTITFKALRNTSGAVEIASGSLLAADGKGSNIISRMVSATYSVTPSRVAPTESDAEQLPEVLGVSEVVPPVLEQPQISALEGESIIVRGYGASRSKILMHWKWGDSEERGDMVMSGESGAFEFALNDVREGVYRIWAEVEDSRGIRSEPSDKIVVNVRAGGYEEVAASSLTVAKTIVPFLLGIATIGAAAGYFLHRRSRREHE